MKKTIEIIILSFIISIIGNNNIYAQIIGNFTISQSAALVVSVDSTIDISCFGLTDGIIYVSASGGVAPYELNFNGGGFNTVSGSDTSYSGLDSGSYYIVIRDVNLCTDSISGITISMLAGLPSANITVSGLTVFCAGDSVKLVSDTANGNQWLFNNSLIGNSTDSIFAKDSGNYQVLVTNTCGTDTSETVKITLNPLPSANITSSDSTTFCNGGSTELISDTAFKYVWLFNGVSTGDTTQNIITNESGNYQVVVTNVFNCSDTSEITSKTIVSLISISAIDISCDDDYDGSASVIINGANSAPYTYQWSNGQNSATISGLIAGTYEVIITDSIGCIVTSSVTIDNTCLYIPTVFTPNGDGMNDMWIIRGVELYPEIMVEVYNEWGSLLFSSKGYSEQWDGGELPAAAYYYIVTIGNGEQPRTGTVTIVR